MRDCDLLPGPDMIIVRSVIAARASLCLFFALFWSSMTQANTYFSGTVVDTQNQPLVGVTVLAGHPTYSFVDPFVIDGQATTDAQGQYAITTLAGNGWGTYVVAAQLAGYVTSIFPNLPCYSGDPLCLDLALPSDSVAPPIASDGHPAIASRVVGRAVSRSRLDVLVAFDHACTSLTLQTSATMLPRRRHRKSYAASAATPGLT